MYVPVKSMCYADKQTDQLGLAVKHSADKQTDQLGLAVRHSADKQTDQLGLAVRHSADKQPDISLSPLWLFSFKMCLQTVLQICPSQFKETLKWLTPLPILTQNPSCGYSVGMVNVPLRPPTSLDREVGVKQAAMTTVQWGVLNK